MSDVSRNNQGLQSDFWLNFKRSRNAVVGSVIVLIVVSIAVLGPYIAPFDPASTSMFSTWAEPGGKHVLGADGLGRDILSRILVGARVSLTVAMVVLAITLVVGTVLGLISGYMGGWIDSLIMRFVDIVFAFPELILAILVASIIGPGTLTVIVALALVYWPGIARMTRALVLSLKSELFVEAAVACGTPTWKIMLKHLLPNIIAPPDRAHVRGRRLFDHGRSHFELPGHRHSGTPPHLGRHDPGRAVRTAHRPVPGPVQFRHSGLHHHRFQPAGRRFEGHPRPEGARQMSDPVLSVRDLSVSFSTLRGKINVIDRLSLEIAPGEILGVVGESGSGKSVTALAVMRLLGASGVIDQGTVNLAGKNLTAFTEDAMLKVRGVDVSMIFQEPMTSLNPVFTVGFQIAETLVEHLGYSKKRALDEAVRLMELVGIPEARARCDEYPHQMSGGMRQRVMIAMGLACRPKLLIADEPTTALDVTIQAQILRLLKSLRDELRMGILLITHDMGVIAEMVDRVLVMYAGQLVESGPVRGRFRLPQASLHPAPAPIHTAGARQEGPPADHPGRGFLAQQLPVRLPVSPPLSPGRGRMRRRAASTGGNRSRPPGPVPSRSRRSAHVGKMGGRAMTDFLRLTGLSKDFWVGGGLLKGKARRLKAVNEIDLSLASGETLGVVGESGCGKTTLGRLILRLLEPSAGSIVFQGRDITHYSRRRMRALRRDMQVVFQDPYSSLNPRLKVFEIIAEPLRNFGLSQSEIKERVAEVMNVVGLAYEYVDRYPHAFSGGQRQRIGVARALVMRPQLIVCDEAVSALDVSVQAQVLNLLADIKKRYHLALFFISHNLGVVRHVSDRIAVMYLGNLVELASEPDLFKSPQHPYTQALISAVPEPDPSRRGQQIILEGDIPSPFNPPPGCPFHPRCPKAQTICRKDKPVLEPKKGEMLAACHFPGPI